MAAEGLDFRHVANQLEQAGAQSELGRWRTMVTLQDAYHRLLDHLELWDRQTARLKAIEFQECQTKAEIVLVGTVDMSVALRQMLDQVSQRVTAYIHAPQEWDSRFDEHGCLQVAAWQSVELPLEEEQLTLVNGPRDQAQCVAHRLASYRGRYRIDEITVGMLDERLVPDVQRELQSRGVPARWGPGRSLRESGPFQLLKAVAAALSHGRFRDYATLVRHPDVHDWMDLQGLACGWLGAWDRHQSQHLPYRWPNEGATFQQDAPLRQARQPAWISCWDRCLSHRADLTPGASRYAKFCGRFTAMSIWTAVWPRTG